MLDAKRLDELLTNYEPWVRNGNYAFICHANSDKAAIDALRLLPLITERLVPVVIDKDTGLDTGSLPHAVQTFQGGKVWSDLMEALAQNAGCILILWSNSMKRRIEQLDGGGRIGHEILIGLRNKTAFFCCIDGEPPIDDICGTLRSKIEGFGPFETTVRAMHVKPLGRRPLAGGRERVQLDNDMMQLAREIHDIIRPRATGNASNVPENMLPYLVNREPQITPICWSVSKRYKSSVDERAASQASLYVVPCRPYDAFETFPWRLASSDGPERCGIDKTRDVPTWVEVENMFWPDPVTPATFQKQFLKNAPKVSRGLSDSRLRERPVCFSTFVLVSSIEKTLRSLVDAWIKSWPELLTQAAGEMPEDARKRRPQPVLSLMFLIFDQRWFSRWLKSDGSRIAELQTLETETPEQDELEVCLLPSLSRITSSDAKGWLARMLKHPLFQRDQSKFQRAESAVDHMFNRSSSGVTMQEFARAIFERRV